jgi:outer membrane protein assembly complex protein YaeT
MNGHRMRLLIALVLAWTMAAIAQSGTDSSWASQAPSAPDTSAIWRIEKIQIEGNHTVDLAVLKGALRFAEGDSLGYDGLIDRQRESIRALLATGLLSDATVDFREGSAGAVVAVVAVRELPLCGNVKFTGNDALTEKDLKEVAHVQDGSLLSQSNVEKDRQAMLKLYRDKGYLRAVVVGDRGALDSLTGKVSLTWKIQEKNKVRVGRIEFVGNARISRKKLLGVIVTKEKRWWRNGEYDQDTLLQDLQKVKDLYREKGYLDASVDSHTVNYRPDSLRLDIRLVIHEGRRYFRGRLSFQGEDVLSERQLMGQATLDSGDVLNQKKLDAEEQNIQMAYREEGRIFAQINPVKTYRDSIVDMLYMIKEGPPASVGQVVVEGNSKTRDKVIRRELRLFPGDLFRQSLLMRSYREVMALNFFDNVMPDIRPAAQDGVVDLVFKVQEKEKGTGTFSAGGAYSQNDGFVGTLGLQIPNVMGTGRLVNANLEYGQYKKSTRLGFTEPWLMDSPTRVGVDGFWTHQKDQYDATYDYISTGFDLTLGRRLTWPDDYFSVSSGYGLSLNQYEGSNSVKTGIVRTDGIESSLSLTLTRDDKDLPMFPTSGSTIQVTYRKVGGPFGGDFDYNQGNALAKWWFPTVGKLVLNVEMQGGIMGGPVLQTNDLYREGGLLGYQGKLRGYDAASIGLYRVGRSYLSSTMEMRYPVADQLFYLIGFMDAGNVYGKALRSDVNHTVLSLPNPWEEIDLGNLKRDWGFGFRLQIPMMGVLGFDFAWGLDPAEGVNGTSVPNTGMHPNFTIEQPF